VVLGGLAGSGAMPPTPPGKDVAHIDTNPNPVRERQEGDVAEVVPSRWD